MSRTLPTTKRLGNTGFEIYTIQFNVYRIHYLKFTEYTMHCLQNTGFNVYRIQLKVYTRCKVYIIQHNVYTGFKVYRINNITSLHDLKFTEAT